MILATFQLTAAMRHRLIWWVRNDLRLHDNNVLSQIASTVAKNSDAATEVLPCFIFDPRQFETTRRGSPKTGAYRSKFLLESVNDLRESLRSIGSDLLVGYGKPEEPHGGIPTGWLP